MRAPHTKAIDSPQLGSASMLRVVDLRPTAEFETCHVRDALNFPVEGTNESPFDFGKPEILQDQCAQLDVIVKDPAMVKFLGEEVSKPLLILDRDGNTSRILAASLRAKGVEAYTFFDGMTGLLQYQQSRYS